MMSNQKVEVELCIAYEIKDAYLCQQFDDEDEEDTFWIPKSQVTIISRTNLINCMEIPEWLAMKHNLV